MIRDAEGCTEKEERRQLFVVFDVNGNGEWTPLETLDYAVDTRPPPTPVPLSVRPGEGLVEVVFGEPESDASEAARYQVLCTTSSLGDR